VNPSLTHSIKSMARELGFSHVGVARVKQLEAEAERLALWLTRGYHASMEWMVRNFQNRIYPQELLPGAKSIVSVGMNYYCDAPQPNGTSTARVSRYAWGMDYHDIVKVRLERLLQFICNAAPGTRGRTCVDTGPVMEKVWAQRAGVGWIGKHSNIITRDLGSWVFLGEIILDIELAYDDSAVDRCGTCTACIKACPTRAIVEPYVVDSNRCISYLTIEHRGNIPEKMVDQLGGWIFGCDICQDVCPWNSKFSRPATAQEFYPLSDHATPDVGAWSRMTPTEFGHKFQKSPIRRTKHTGLMRNLALARRTHQPTQQ